jgi:dipeptidyl aminopeptidase/acylaminoacyl peptidase
VRALDDFCSLRLPGMPTLSASGERMLVSVQSVDSDSEGVATYQRQLWELLDAGAAPLMTSKTFDTAPVFAPTSDRFAFLSNRTGQKRAFLAETTTAVDATDGVDLDGTPSAIAWIDDDHLVIVVDSPVETLAKDAPVVIDWLRYKQDGRAGFVDSRSSLWLATVGDPAATRKIYAADGTIGSIAATESEIVFTVGRVRVDDDAVATDVRRLRLDAGAVRSDEVVWRAAGAVTALAITDLSHRVIAISNSPVGQSAVPASMWSISVGAEPVRCFVDGDYECERTSYGDSRHFGAPTIVRPIAGTDDVAFLAMAEFDVALYVGSPTEPNAKRITPFGMSVVDFSEVRDGQVLVCLESPTAPVECFLLSVSGDTQSEAVTSFNSAWVVGEPATAPETVSIAASDGVALSALLYRASENTDGALVTKIHGGPHLSIGTSFDSETQLLLQAGFSVLLPNIRGSAGSGSAFRAMSIGQWGGKDYEDVTAFADWAVATGVASADKLYLTGGSYGGFLVNWALTHSGRYRAAIAERSISNFISKIGTADNGATSVFELGGLDVRDDELARLWELSPLRLVSNVTTPLLLLHGEADYRCPIEQSEQLFAALRRRGKEAVFVRYPGESHGMAVSGTPVHRIDRTTRILDWFGSHR